MPSQHTSSLSQPEDAQESSTLSELLDKLNLDSISSVLSTPSSTHEVQFHDEDSDPFGPVSLDLMLPPINLSSAVATHPRPQPSLEPERILRIIPFSEDRRGPMVPQKRYEPHTSSDRRRYVDEVILEPSTIFYLQQPDERGIPLRDAMHGRFARLVGRDEPMFQERGPSISVRLNWPGYQPWSRQIPTRDFRNPPGPITRAKLAKNVAKSVARFIAERNARSMEEDNDPVWAVGHEKIDVFDLVLVRLDHVSKGSWQAQLQLIRPRT